MTSYRIGAIFYIIWGILHLGSGVVGIWLTGQPTTPDWASGMAAVPTLASGLNDAGLGLIRQHSFNIAVGGTVAIIIAAIGNWQNARWAWAVNAVLIALLDLGMILFILAPGHVPLIDGLIGPALWLGGLVLTTLALRGDTDRTHSPNSSPEGTSL